MFDEINKDKNRKPILTYYVAAVATIVTLTTVINPEYSYSFFGSLEGGVSLLSIFTVPFQHGFDQISAIIHLGFSLFFWIILGSFVEKLYAPKKFLLVVVTVIIINSIYIFSTGLPGHGLTPLIFSLIPLMIASMMEATKIKLANAYVKTFKLFRNLMGVFALISIVMFSFVPIYFKFNNTNRTTKSVIVNKNQGGIKQGVRFKKRELSTVNLFDSEAKRYVFGNFMNLVGLIIGFVFGYKFKKRVGGTLNRFNKHKELSEKNYKPIYLFIGGYGTYLLIVYIASFFIGYGN